jgi:2-polyprenyl-6-methoxyphenol hydroxylase-like FAD-dependent oxidoreductase
MEKLTTQCCIAGGGPAGVMLGLLLARAGVNVVVLEKHADFFRDFRGDTVHPSTLEMMNELGYLGEFLAVPHQEMRAITVKAGKETFQFADFSNLPVQSKFIALMPQWDFLNFLAKKGSGYPGFSLRMKTEVTGLLERDGVVRGVTATTPGGSLEVSADLSVASDGRHSILRSEAGLESDDFGAPMDVLWFRLSRRSDDWPQPLVHADAGRVVIMLDRGDYWQCAYIIPKGGTDQLRAQGIDTFRAKVLAHEPFLGERVAEIASWDDVKLLVVQVNRLRTWWKSGLLCIGDAAHAMSPVGGVGINLAVQDAVAAANLLARPLKEGRVGVEHLAAFQKRRARAAQITRRLQIMMQNAVIGPALEEKGPIRVPLLMRLLTSVPLLSRIPARLIGYGVRPEHVATFIRNTSDH